MSADLAYHHTNSIPKKLRKRRMLRKVTIPPMPYSSHFVVGTFLYLPMTFSEEVR